MILQTSQADEVAGLLYGGKIGILPTDTIYGIHCLAHKPELVQRIYEIKDRPSDLPLITVISKVEDLKEFNLIIGDFEHQQIKNFWPGPNTLIFKTTQHNKTRAFRLPKNDFIISILQTTGPLVSTSANLHGLPSATNISQANEYFGDKIDFYVDGGELQNPPSSIYDVSNGEVNKIR
jgi:L-threonylcarbamoyladenylate synthase